MNLAEGEAAVRLARDALESSLGADPPLDPADPFRDRPLPPVFDEARGVFVTLERHPSGALRGCIGFSHPIFPLRSAIPRAASAAAREDPRFPPVQGLEAKRLTIEVSVLTVPELIEPPRRTELPGLILVGRDGIIVEGFGSSGLLLPQVAPEQGWDAQRFLDETSMKAGLPADAWLDRQVRVRKFQAEIFRESSPAGPVSERPAE